MSTVGVQQRTSYLRLLVSLIVLGMMYPVLATDFGAFGLHVGNLCWTLSFWAALYMALHALQCSRRVLRVARVLMSLVVVLSLARITFGLTVGVGEVEKGILWWANMAVALMSVAFLALTTFEILKDVLTGTTGELDRIWGAVCVYILMGLFWAYGFFILWLIDPQDQIVGPDPHSSFSLALADLLYFSFVNLTTLGYGDFVPKGHVARLLSTSEALVGQLYLMILIARLVGLHVFSSRGTRETD